MQFYYKATKSSGEVYENTIEAADRFAVYQQIKKEGGTAVSVREVSTESWLDLSRLSGFFGRVKMYEVITFARSLGAMISAGLPMSRALAGLERQATNKKFKLIIGGLARNIEQGGTFSDALKAYPSIFSSLFVSMVRAGEESGGLAAALGAVARQMDQTYALKKKIRGAMTYPIVVMAAMVIVGAVMLIYVVPTLSGTFRELGVPLPASTRAVIAVSNFLSTYTVTGLTLIALITLGIAALLRSRRGKRGFEFVLLHTPLIAGLVKETNTARTARTLSSLLTAGVDVVGALSITRDVLQNSYFKEVLASAEKNVQTGATLTSLFSEAEHLYPSLFVEMIAVGEETGALSDMLTRVADFYEEEVAEKTKNMSTIIEPFLMVVIGAVVGFFAVSMISPIYSISSAIQ